MSAQPYRLKKGGIVDRDHIVNFTFDGKTYQGYNGDTLASALLANGVWLFGRSFKYHRPRGVFTAGSDEPNALVELHHGGRLEPNTRATTVEIYEGLTANSQNCWPSLKRDFLSVNRFFSPIFVAGFYYKTFMWPANAWMFYERFIRRAAGLGRASTETDPDRYEKMHGFCDLLVVGAGPSGITAAVEAATNGERVFLVDEFPDIGGSLRFQNSDKMEDWLWGQHAALAKLDNVTVLTRTTAFGAYDHGTFGLLERVTDHMPHDHGSHQPRQRLWIVRARRVIYATGASERPLVFGNNDKPGVMLTSAIRTYANYYGVLPGKRIVLFTNNDSAYSAAIELSAYGAQVGVVDSRGDSAMAVEAASKGISCFRNSRITTAIGGRRLKAVKFYDAYEGKHFKVKCDVVGLSGGWSPNVHLQCHKGAKPDYDNRLLAFVPRNDRTAEITVGSANGIWDFNACVESARRAVQQITASDHLRSNSINCEALWQVEDIHFKSKGKAFVDFQNDVTVSDIKLAEREGYRSVEHLKRYTTLGMATDQGKTANLNGLGILAQAREQEIAEVGVTTYRPPYSPVAVGALVGQNRGQHVAPKRLTPIHDWHVDNGAVMLNVGMWLRPWYYPQQGENIHDAYVREADHVRNKVGLIDVTTLGKISVQGPDSAEFLNRLYINGFKRLPVNKSRYGIMLREDGVPFDDGTVGRLSEFDYVITTTTANAARVMLHMEYHAQVVWPGLRVHVTSVTDQWATIALAGPHSRSVLTNIVDKVDVSDQALPFMGILQTTIQGVEARVFRISFSGELGYEINIPANYGYAVWEYILTQGEEFCIAPYGTEAMGALRVEKGHVVGAELDGRNTLHDLHFSRMASDKKGYVGRFYRNREAFNEPDRPRLVGLLPVHKNQPLKSGSQITNERTFETPHSAIGHVTSTTYSPALQRYIALGLVAGGLEREGDEVFVQYPLKNETVHVTVVNPVFFDPEGERIHA